MASRLHIYSIPASITVRARGIEDAYGRAHAKLQRVNKLGTFRVDASPEANCITCGLTHDVPDGYCLIDTPPPAEEE